MVGGCSWKLAGDQLTVTNSRGSSSATVKIDGLTLSLTYASGGVTTFNRQEPPSDVSYMLASAACRP